MRIMDDHPDMNANDLYLINKMKPVIVLWAEQGRWDDIAREIPCPLLMQNEGKIPNMTLTKHGQEQLENWVLMEYGMNCREVRYEWAKNNPVDLGDLGHVAGSMLDSRCTVPAPSEGGM